MKSVVICFVFTLNSLNFFASDATGFHLIYKIHPLAAINPLRPTAQGSLEAQFGRRWGVAFTYGYQYIYRMKFDTLVVTDPKGQTIKVDFKYYIGNPVSNYHNGKFALQYLGIGLWYVEESGNELFRYSGTHAGVHVKNRIIAINYGFVVDHKRYTLECILNAGVRFKERTMDWLDNRQPVYDNKNGGWGFSHTYNFKGIAPHVGMGVRIGYRLF